MSAPSRLPEPITSLQNAQVKRLVRLWGRRERVREGVLLVEGARELSRARAGGVTLRGLYACPELFSPEAEALWPAVQQAAPLTLLSRPAFEKVSVRDNPDGLLAECAALEPRLPEPGGVLLVVVGLEKPGNLGALLRTADGAGAAGVLVLGEGLDLGNPNVIRASQGSLFTLPVAALSEADGEAWLRQHAYTLAACTPEGAQTYWDAPLTGRVALLLGSEHDGLPPHWRELADLRLAIPMRGEADSLNVATAGALVLYEALRQQRAAAGQRITGDRP